MEEYINNFSKPKFKKDFSRNYSKTRFFEVYNFVIRKLDLR